MSFAHGRHPGVLYLLPLLSLIMVLPGPSRAGEDRRSEAPAAPSPPPPAPPAAPASTAAAPPAAIPPAEAGPGPFSDTALAEEIARASEEIARGARTLESGKGSRRLKDAAESFTAAIDRLALRIDDLDDAARRLLASAYEGRARTEVLRGRQTRADEDFSRLVDADPAYRLDPARTPRRTLERFDRLRSARIAFVTLQADPPESEVAWSGRRLGPASSWTAERPVLAGAFTLTARLDCHEERAVAGVLEAGEKRVIAIHLEPAGRTIRFETVPAGFDVELDGTVVGRTSLEGSIVGAPAVVSRPKDLPREVAPEVPPHPGEEGPARESEPLSPEAESLGVPLRGSASAAAGEEEARGLDAAAPPAEVPQPPDGGPVAQDDEGVRAGAIGPGAGPVPAEPGRDAGAGGVEASRTGGNGDAGSLTVGCVAAGDHPFALRRDCYKEKRGTVPVVIDFFDRSAQVVPRIAPARLAVHLSVTSDVPEAEVLLDGTSLGDAPVEDHVLCPGRKKIEVRRAGRLAWFEEVDLEDGAVAIEARRRPTLGRLFAEGSAKEAVLLDVAARLRERLDRLTAFNRPSNDGAESREALNGILRSLQDQGPVRRDLRGVDLLLYVESLPEGDGRSLRLKLVSAIPEADESAICATEDGACLDRFFGMLENPWPRKAVYTGLSLGRQPRGGRGLVVLGSRGSARDAGIREGDRIAEVEGKPVSTARDLQVVAARALERAESGAIDVALERDGRRIGVRLPVRLAPEIAPPGDHAVAAARILAASELDAALMPPGETRNAALLNLASALIGRRSCALAMKEALDREGWSQNVAGAAAAGVAAFLQGLCGKVLGQSAVAEAAFRRAAADEGATLWLPDGIPVAPLARLALP